MSKYTTELRFICETCADLTESEGQSKISEIIALARPKIFDFNYPIFDQNYKEELETKIIRHFYLREIAFETVGIWKLKLEDKMNIIMPYFNKLYDSELIKYNPLLEVDYTKTGSNENNGSNNRTENRTNNQSNTSNRTNYNMFADTPQMQIVDIPTNANNATLTNLTKDIDNDTNTLNITEQGTDNTTLHNKTDYVERIIGKVSTSSYMKLIQELRDTFLNIDSMIIESLDDLFMRIW